MRSPSEPLLSCLDASCPYLISEMLNHQQMTEQQMAEQQMAEQQMSEQHNHQQWRNILDHYHCGSAAIIIETEEA